ncbi:MAG: ABC transporter substrate-binding protein [Deltaproteobacteria bacterium]|jgi:ABC-type nitrate/sulfonate/bicarbonate transport system substrate-binding protein|nr:ABC transporter substrate-binding protein [Deltaproteobacteria bacterium]
MKFFFSFFGLFLAFIFLASCGDNNSAPTGQNQAPAAGSQSKSSAQPSAASPAKPQEAAPPADLAEDEVWENGKKYFVLKLPVSVDAPSPEIFLSAEENGFFEQSGLKTNYVGSVPGNQTLPSILKGIIHTNGRGHVNTTIAAISAGAKIKAVAQKTESTKKQPHMVAIVKKDSPINTAQDLVGKKIGSPGSSGCNGYFHLAYLRQAGIPDVKNAADLVVIKEAVIEQALRQGDIDVALTHKLPDYYATNDEFRVIFSDYDIWENRGGGTPYFFSLDFIKNRPDVVRAFATAMAKTANWANEHPLENREITARRFKMDINVVTERYYAPNAIIQPDTVTVWLELLEEFKEIQPGLPLDKIFTNEFNPFYKS